MLPKKETLTIEFKSDKKKYSDSDIFEAVVSFANTEGGDLYLGIEDSGEVTGVHDSHKNPITLSAFIANNTIPPVSIRAEIINDIFPEKYYTDVLRQMEPLKMFQCIRQNLLHDYQTYVC